MRIITKITESEAWDRHKESVVFFVKSILIYSFLPVWITLFIMLLTGHWSNIDDLWEKGAFFIYSASLLYSANEMMEGYLKKGSVNLVTWLYPISWFLIILSAVGFSVAIVPDLFTSGGQIDKKTITLTSSFFILISLCVIYYAHYRTNRKLDPDGANRKIQDNIMDKLS